MAGENEMLQEVAEAIKTHIAGGMSTLTDVKVGDHSLVVAVGEHVSYIFMVRQVTRR